MDITTYLSEQLIDTFFTAGTVYIAEHTADPGATGANEVSTGIDANYVRRAATMVKSLDGTVYRARNNADISFPAAAGGSSYNVTHISVWDAITAGNCLAQAALTGGTLPVVAGTINTFATNDIVVRGE